MANPWWELLGADVEMNRIEKGYDRVDIKALWSVLKIYGVGGQLLKEIQDFYREANACVRVGGEFSEFCSGGGNEAGVCDVTMVV